MTAKVGIIGGSGFYKMENLNNREEKVVETPFGKPSSTPVEGRFENIIISMYWNFLPH